jgi:hypothetical protein
MKKLSTLLLVALLVGCNSIDIEGDIPECIMKKIKEFADTHDCDSSEVSEFTFQANLVYVFSDGNCWDDSQAEVLDSNCKTIGYLGGIIGNTMINGEEFSNATLIRSIWKK